MGPSLSRELIRVAADCIPTHDKPPFIRDKSCLFCETECESIRHVFWECPFAKPLWFSCLFPIRIDCKFLEFTGCLFDGIWRAGNESLFKGKAVDIHNTRSNILRRFQELNQIQLGSLSNVSDKRHGKVTDMRTGRWTWYAKQNHASSVAEGKMQAIRWAFQLGLAAKAESIAIASNAKKQDLLLWRFCIYC
ncbi:hypothetical protein F8388_002971 [Cannabis sativa]|uniref:Reverse transcriptase zinc-binding domain-containing protein n=1 Tax=Cannabis sativa TaxID=3483 RepID=A0A7J6H6H0_CANSA|nr:hypothetical protein F8388_002971 [Cannabis sativa]